MPPALLIVVIGFVFIVAFGTLSLLRQQGLSLRFALEGLLLTAIGMAVVLAGLPLHPLLFFVVLYLVTMRTRLLVDLGNMFLSRGQYERALAVYRFALRLFPDVVDRRIVLINWGATQLRMQEPAAACRTLEEALAGDPVRVGAKYLAAGHYNLAVAYERTGREAEAVRLYNQVIDMLPNSLYGRAAQEALKRRKGQVPRGSDEELP